MSVKLTRARGPVLIAVTSLIAILLPISLAVAANRVVVKTLRSAKLGKTILVNVKGHTLYRLSAEHNGRFVCTDKACLSFWHPLVVRKGVKPAGTPGLATVNRPDGRRQVTFRNEPLYSFAGDKARGDVKGEGFKDVGVWHAASPKASSPTPSPPAGGYPYGP